MKRCLLLCICCLSCCVYTVSFARTDTQINDAEFSVKKYDYLMDKAAENIVSNIDFWVTLKKEVDGATGLGWRLSLGRKLPSQPIAVLTIMQRTGVNVSDLCLPPFMEGSADYEVDQWLLESRQTLQAFIMKDPALEALRKTCLQVVESVPLTNNR